MDNQLFIGTVQNPYHLSVGVVLINEKNEICCHHFQSGDGLKNLYILMRETVENGDTLEMAAERGLEKEFGIKGNFKRYLGSITSYFPRDGVNIEKTTVYLLYGFAGEISKTGRLEKHFDWIEKDLIEWKNSNDLIKVMKAQVAEFGRSDFDESKILERI